MLASMRWRLAAGLGLGLGLAHACGDQGFACSDDAQCTLAGDPGRCVAGGRCAYPEPTCPSGLAYPQGAPTGLAGECVPVDDAASGTDGDTAATAEASADESTTPPTTEATADGSSGPAACDDEHEPNDDQTQASPIPFGSNGGGCQATWNGSLADPLDADWFVLETTSDTCPVGTGLTILTEPTLELCAVPQCPSEVAPELTACDGELVELATGQACCGVGQVQVTVSCFGVRPTVAIGIPAAADTLACLPFAATASS